MAINLTKILNQVQDRINDSATTDRDLDKLIKIADRINNSGVQVKTYGSTGQLPTISDSAYIGTIAYVSSDNIFGDSDGRFYYASGTDSGWRGFTTTQDSAEALIEAPGAAAEPHVQQYNILGTEKGYSFSGNPLTSNTMSYSYVSDAGGTTISGLTLKLPDGSPTGYGRAGSSSSSDTHGYFIDYEAPGYPTGGAQQRFPYAAEDAWSTFPQSGTTAKDTNLGGTSGTHIYVAGGTLTPPNVAQNAIEKFPHASADGSTMTDVGDLVYARGYMSGQFSQSETHGYFAGGLPFGGTPSTAGHIDKWPFASDANATDVGEFNPAGKYGAANVSGTDYGYIAGGTPPTVNEIKKWSYTSDGNATDVGDLVAANYYFSGSSSTTDGYIAQGASDTDAIEKWPFASDANSASVGAASYASYNTGSSQK